MSFRLPNLGLFGGFEKCESSDILSRLNENFTLLDFLTDIAIEDRVADFASLPASPSTGDRYITDDTNSIWYFTDTWVEFVPTQGIEAFDKSTNELLVFNGTIWRVVSNEIPDIVRPKYTVKFPQSPGDGSGPVYTADAEDQVIYIRGAFNEVQLPATPDLGKHYLIFAETLCEVKIGTFVLADLNAGQAALCVYADSVFGWASFTGSDGVGGSGNIAPLSSLAGVPLSSFPTGTEAQVGWSQIIGDLSFVDTPITINGRVNITKTGVYMVSAELSYNQASWPSNSYAQLQIRVNGSEVAKGPRNYADGTINHSASINPYRLNLTAGDYVEIFQFHDSLANKVADNGPDAAILSSMNIVEVI